MPDEWSLDAMTAIMLALLRIEAKLDALLAEEDDDGEEEEDSP